VQLTVFHKTNFALFSIYKKDIWKRFVSLLSFLSIYLLIATLSYTYIYIPSQKIQRFVSLNRVFTSRLEFLRYMEQQINIREKYINKYYAIIDKHKFSNVWSVIWAELSKALPENAWIQKILWAKENNTYIMHLHIQMEKGDYNTLKQINEFLRSIKQSRIMSYFSDVILKEMNSKEEGYTISYHIVFTPKQHIGITL